MLRRCPKQFTDPRFIHYYQVFTPSNTSVETLVGEARPGWYLEACFQSAKDQLGLGDYKVCSWTGWHCHTVLVLGAQAFLRAQRCQLELGPPVFAIPLQAVCLAVLRPVDSCSSESCTTEALAVQVSIISLLVSRVCDALVLLGQNLSSSGSMPSLPWTFPSSVEIIYNCSALQLLPASLPAGQGCNPA